MSKITRVILNILIVIASLVLVCLLAVMVDAIKYATRKLEDPVESHRTVFEYELKHRAYDEIIDTYYVQRMKSLEAPEGMEDIYNVGEYAHTSFMSRVYAAKGDEHAISSNAERMENLRERLGDYRYTADEVDAIIKDAP